MPGIGNITDDPLFVDPENYDYCLQFGSPCIDAGDPHSPLDPDGTRADMGAFFYNQGTGVGDHKSQRIPSGIGLLSSYPNPFNPSTTISFTLVKTTQFELRIYDLQGNLIENILNTQMQEGNHEVVFQAEGRTSGIYLARLTTAGFTETLKLILMK